MASIFKPDMTVPPSRDSAAGSIELLPQGDSFVIKLVSPDCEAHQMALPSWAVNQLMRALPRLDAALAQGHDELASDLIAYPAEQWSVQRTSADGTVAMSVQNDQQVESAFLFAPDEAAALFTALGEAIGFSVKKIAVLPPAYDTPRQDRQRISARSARKAA